MPDDQDDQQTPDDQSTTAQTTSGGDETSQADQDQPTAQGGQQPVDQNAAKAAYENGPRDDGAYAGGTDSVEVAAADTAGTGQTAQDATGDGGAVMTSGDDKGGGGPSLGDMVKVGEFVYKIMQDSQPTVTMGSKSATVLP